MVVVVRGDSLSMLAARYLGDGDRWPEIFALNRDVVDDPDEIDIGWRLKLPTGVAAAGTLGTAPAGTGSVSSATEESGTRSEGVTTASTTAPTPVDEPMDREVSEHAPAPVPRDQPTESAAAPTADPETDSSGDHLSVSQALAMGIVGTVGAGMASAVVRTIHRRRDVQLALRPVGRRIPFPSPDTMRVESALTLVGLTTPPTGSAIVAPEDDEPTIVGPRRGIPEPVYPALALVTVGYGT